MGSGAAKCRVANASFDDSIEAEIRRAASESKRTIKMLLLGAGESGKSTVLKQMRILHNEGFSQAEYELQKTIIFIAILKATITIIRGMATFSLNFDSFETNADASAVLNIESYVTNNSTAPCTLTLSADIMSALKRLWKDKGVLECFQRRRELELHDSTKYFFDELGRICADDYVPNRQDMLQASVRTTGIVEVTFEAKNMRFRVVDVGGQRTERRKWMHCFDDVEAVIFVTSLSEYDQRLTEDRKTNRMLESVALFESVVNSKWFTKTNMILFFNKMDLFKEKLEHQSITVAFTSYTGSQGFEESAKYIQSRFLSRNHNHERSIYWHLTCATDTKQIEFVIESTIEMVAEKNVFRSGLQ